MALALFVARSLSGIAALIETNIIVSGVESRLQSARPMPARALGPALVRTLGRR
jgi:hypothetical protein